MKYTAFFTTFLRYLGLASVLSACAFDSPNLSNFPTLPDVTELPDRFNPANKDTTTVLYCLKDGGDVRLDNQTNRGFCHFEYGEDVPLRDLNAE